jgi:RNA polymerase sigma-70 factor (ECF subfamily)
MQEPKNYANMDSGEFLENIYQYWQRLFHLALNLRGNVDDAEDAVQDVLLKATAKRHQFRGEANIYTWLVRILINYCHEKFQKDKRNPRNTLELNSEQSGAYEKEIPDYRENPLKKIELSEQSESLISVIQKLKPPLKEVIILRYYENMPYQEIATVLKVPEGTVKSRLNHARDIMKKLLDQMGLGEV